MCRTNYPVARKITAEATIEDLSRALHDFRQDTGRFPEESEGLAALRSAPANSKGWNGPYYPRDIPTDPWGHHYIYRMRNGDYNLPKIGTLGADGKHGGKDFDADMFQEVDR